MERAISEQTLALLRRMAGVEDSDPLPDKLLDEYWQWKRCANRIDHGASISDLVWMCRLAGYGRSEDAPQVPTIRELKKQKQVKVGDTVLVQWRGSEVEATFQRLHAGGEIAVEFADGTERRVPDAHVRLAELVEA